MGHSGKLERMYLSAPIDTQVYVGITLHVSAEREELALPITSKFHHAAKAMHGAVYVKMLDDAAVFAVNSIVEDVLVYTVYVERAIIATGRARLGAFRGRAWVQGPQPVQSGLRDLP